MGQLVQGLVECRCSHVRGEDVTIRDVTIKPPERQGSQGREKRHTRKHWGFEKKSSSWYLGLGPRKSIFGARWGQTSSLRWCVCGAGVLHVVGFRWKISIEGNCLSLSLALSSCRKTCKPKKVNKSFVPEPISSFSDSDMRYEHSMWISDFTYLGRVFRRDPMLHNLTSIICLHAFKWKIHILFVSEKFVGNFILKWVKTNLLAH